MVMISVVTCTVATCINGGTCIVITNDTIICECPQGLGGPNCDTGKLCSCLLLISSIFPVTSDSVLHCFLFCYILPLCLQILLCERFRAGVNLGCFMSPVLGDSWRGKRKGSMCVCVCVCKCECLSVPAHATQNSTKVCRAKIMTLHQRPRPEHTFCWG